MNLAKNFASRREILSRSRFYFGRQGSCRDSRKHPSEILAAEKLLPGENLDEIRGRIPARFWPPGFLLPGENHGEIRGRIPARFLTSEIFASRRESRRDSQRDRGEILAAGNFASRRESCRDPAGIPAERKNPGGQNLAAISAGFPSRSRRDPARSRSLFYKGYFRQKLLKNNTLFVAHTNRTGIAHISGYPLPGG